MNVYGGRSKRGEEKEKKDIKEDRITCTWRIRFIDWFWFTFSNKFSFFWFNDTLTLECYLMPNPVYTQDF